MPEMANVAGWPQGKQRMCAYCDRTFTKVEHLKRHQRSHTGERPFKCTYCGKRYARSDVLARHYLQHSGETDSRGGNIEAFDADTEDKFPDLDRHEPRNTNMNLQRPQDNVPDLVVVEPPGRQSPHVQEDEHNIMLDKNGLAAFDPVGFDHSLTAQSNDLDDNNRTFFPQSQPQLYHTASESTSMPQTNLSTQYLRPDGIAQSDQSQLKGQDTPGSSRLQAAIMDESSRNGEMIPGKRIANRSDSSTGSPPGRQRAPSGLSSQQAGGDLQLPRSVGHTASQETNSKAVHNLFVQSTETLSHHGSLSSPPTGDLSHGPSQIDTLIFPERDPFDFNFDASSGALDLQMSPNMMNLLYISPSTAALSPSYLNNSFRPNQGPRSPFSMEQLKRIQKLWPRQKTVSAVHFIRTIWRDTAQHGADNLFSEPSSCDMDSPSAQSCQRSSRWIMDETCRNRLISDISTLGRRGPPSNADSDFSAQTPEAGQPYTSPGSSDSDFPSTGTLDTSLDFFFRSSYPAVPFIHKATFDARKTPTSILFPMCLIGISVMDPQGSKDFVRQHLAKMMHSCRVDLTSKALGRCRPVEMVQSLGSALLVLYLALSFVKEFDECQVLLLCAQMLRIAEKYGFFAAYDGTDPIIDMLGACTDGEGLWKTWARMESVKRIILCLIWMDSAYTWLMGTSGVIEIEKTEIMLPCEAILFEARTAASFLLATDAGNPMATPRMHMQHVLGPPTAELNDLSMRTFLAALHLQILNARHRLLLGNSSAFEGHCFVPAQAFAVDVSARYISTMLVSLPGNHNQLFQSTNTATTLMWNNLCMMLTADMDLLELASGRGDGENTRSALVNVATWSRSVGARRAVLHAAQIFKILSGARIPERNLLMPELLLFNAALVLGFYLYSAPRTEDNNGLLALEVLDDIDWNAVGSVGLSDMSGAPESYQCSQSSPQQSSYCAKRGYITQDGLISFDGEVQLGGEASAQKILLSYAHLIDEVSHWQGSEYSQLLRALGDFIIADEQ